MTRKNARPLHMARRPYSLWIRIMFWIIIGFLLGAGTVLATLYFSHLF